MINMLDIATHTTMPPGENIRLQVLVSPYYLKRLKYWAKLSGKTPSAYASQILSARIEANFEDINKQLQNLAELEGISVKELIKLWDSEE
jgi:hypothetical protein